MEQTVIVGGGLAGLSCAFHLKDSPYELLERSGYPGGVATSFQRDGFVFDCTGHWLHLREDATRDLVTQDLALDLVEVERRAAIYSHGIRTPYPFQANTFGLPSRVVADCVLGFFEARERRLREPDYEPVTFEDFILLQMGEGIAKHFMVPYNQKIWGVHPREMTYQRTKRFVPLPSPEEVVLGAVSPDGSGRSLGYNTKFLYPREGGIGQLARALAERLPKKPRFEEPVERIDWQERVVLTSAGSHPYRNLVNTMPLDKLVSRIEDAPASVREASAKLRATSITYWDIGLPNPNRDDDPHWMYFPEDDVPFYRAGSASAALSNLAPQGCRSLYVETSHPQGTDPHVSEEEILNGLERVGLKESNETPVVCQRTTLEGAYVVMDRAYDAARDTILSWLSKQEIHSIGRYGNWTYDSMEGALIQGRDAAQSIRKASGSK